MAAKKKPGAKKGRQSGYTVALAAEICARMSEGKSLRSICRDDKMPSRSMVFRWLADRDEFRVMYDIAMEQRTEAFAEDILEISDDGTGDWQISTDVEGKETMVYVPNNVQRDRLKVDTRKWLMARMKPKKYGDRSTHELEGALTVRSVTTRIVEHEPPTDDDDE